MTPSQCVNRKVNNLCCIHTPNLFLIETTKQCGTGDIDRKINKRIKLYMQNANGGQMYEPKEKIEINLLIQMGMLFFNHLS